MFSRDDLLVQARRRYPDFLRAVVGNLTYFPLEVRVGKSRRAKTYTERAAELAEFRSAAAELGLTVDWRMVSDPRFGPHERPERAYFANEEAFIRALNKSAEVRSFLDDVALIRSRCPALESWLPGNVQPIIDHHAVWPEILNVAQWFRENPRSGLYLRQIPVEGVDTKFFERNRTILDQLLLFLQPDKVDTNKQRFEACHGLRWEEPLVRLRFLDDRLRIERGFPVTDLAVPAPIFRSLDLRQVTTVITENLRNFLALPVLTNAVAILGSGDAAALLADARWLTESRILYWGDMDARGFAILARLREEYGQTKSVLMDLATLEAHRRWAVKVPQIYVEYSSLNSSERSALKSICAEGLRLEQERLPFAVAVEALSEAISNKS